MTEEALSKHYDFVIIGGGTAGLTLAARLTEDPSISVLVLEAGENRQNDPNIDIPAFVRNLYENPDYDWGLKSTPQAGLNNRVIAQPRGKVLGGSSAINFLMVAHPSKDDIDNWASLGNTGWDYETLSPYYQKFETHHAPDPSQAAELGSDIFDLSLHGSFGPLQVTFPAATTQLDHSWRPTFAELGLDAKDDPRRGHILGAYTTLKSIDPKGKRTTAASAFYFPNVSRANLTVVTSAHVEKIIFNYENNKDEAVAKGVIVSALGREYTVPVIGEVVLSAGTFLSPKILELSGIGSKKILQANNIPMIIENSYVGENLQDHVLVPLHFEAIDGMTTSETIKQPGVLDWALKEWQSGHGGPLATGVSGTSFLSLTSIAPHIEGATTIQSVEEKVSQARASEGIMKQLQIQKRVFLDKAEADIQISFGSTGFNVHDTGHSLALLFQHHDPGNYAGAAVGSTHAFSRGSCHISGPNPKLDPTIDPGYMSNPADIDILADGILFIQKIFETGPLAALIKDHPNGNGKLFQPSMKLESRLDKVMAVEWVKETAISSWHPIGTCSMLPRVDGGVVDTQLKVYGTANLRVVDASIMPLHIRGNIQTSVYAIAERAADIIKEGFPRKSV